MTRAEEYLKYMNEQRDYLAAHREEYEEARDGLRNTAVEVLTSITLKLMTVNADSEPHRSHWVCAQCRSDLEPMNRALRLIKEFEKTREKVSKYDKAQAVEE